MFLTFFSCQSIPPRRIFQYQLIRDASIPRPIIYVKSFYGSNHLKIILIFIPFSSFLFQFLLLSYNASVYINLVFLILKHLFVKYH